MRPSYPGVEGHAGEHRRNEGEDGEEVVQIVFDDGSTHVLASNTAEGLEFTDIARKVVEIGV